MWLVLRAPKALLATILALALAVGATLEVAQAEGRGAAPAWSGRGPAVANGVIWWVPTTTNAVALTFDDGPDPTFTPQVLAQLSQHQAVATFFVLGTQAARFPNIVRAAAAQGDEICGHGWTHLNFRGRRAATVRQSVERTTALLRSLGVPACPFFRFPYFASDATARAAVAGLGYRLVGADVDTRDYQRPPVERMVERVLAPIRPGDIVLFHDGGGDRRRTVEALGLILDGLAARGLRPVTVAALLASTEHGAPPAERDE